MNQDNKDVESMCILLIKVIISRDRIKMAAQTFTASNY